MSSEGDSIRGLGTKLVDLKKYRDAIQGEVAQESGDITMLEAELQKLRAELESKSRQQEQRTEKLKRVNLIIQETEAALKKISDNTIKLDQVIERELASIKKPF